MAVTISIEVELGWGVHDLEGSEHLSENGEAERNALGRLLDHCDRVDVPVSFDVVGHLLEDECDGTHDGPHGNGWFEADPGTDAEANPLFYAPAVGHEILGRQTDHELCTHTYSHVICGDASPETVAWELRRAQSQLETLTGSAAHSVVPPRHSPPERATLRGAGIETVRVSRDTSDRGRLARAGELVVGPHPTFEPRLVDGVVETYCTSYPSLTASTLPSGQRPPPPPFRALPVGLRQRLHRRYLSRAVDAAVESDGDCHLWCHLYDLANDAQWPPVREFLTELGARRDRGEVDVVTMASLNERVRSTREVAATDD
ncbi:polysaccharide deacetylase family protein [Halobacterium rubrum]|uniref:polysaccharide deacetylase family protein n=1 Tax=Halobacterium TaxID=2239 RepID=UPI001F000D8F|nr:MULTISPECIES: polysaccharide deacetylase family protein [Halobacterium]MDH5021543.1 polysaccharide deacetylase family protein [Halobacterium rubrum]